MDDKNSFFKFIWRLNSIVILAIGVFCFVFLTFSAYEFYKRKNSKDVNSVVNIENKELKEKFSFEGKIQVLNDKYQIIPLSSIQNYEQSYYSKNAHAIKNYLFTDLKTSESYWLLDKNNYLILDLQILEKKDLIPLSNDVKALLYTIVKKDTNSDKRLSSEDNFSLFLSDVSGKNYKELIFDIQEFISWQFINSEEIIIFYKKDDKYFSSNIDIQNFVILNSKEIKLKKGN